MKDIRRSLVAAALFAVVAVAPAQTWTRVVSAGPPEAGLTLLMTDGSVLVHRPSTPQWWKLTPNAFGDYIHGTWTQIASMQNTYGPLYYASAVLADGRVVVSGGEYNFGAGVWTTLGARYNPDTNQWTPLPAPAGWGLVGDTQCAVMPDGKFVMANLTNTQMASLDPATMLWSNYPSAGKTGRFNEEGWSLMPDGTLLTVDCSNAPHTERYLPGLGQWISAGDTPANLVDPPSLEIGPQVLMADGKVIAFGATGKNAVYTPGTNLTDPGSWAAAPDFPLLNGSPLTVADGPACLLPNGKVLVGASPEVFNSPTKFFEFDGTNLNSVPETPNSPGNPCFVGNMLMLPTGQVMYTDFSDDVEIYTPTGNVTAAWRPTITNPPSTIVTGTTFTLTGTQFNGLSQCSSYGDDSSNATNYPLVRITNIASGHVTYCKTLNHSTMAVATGPLPVSTSVIAPNTTEDGASRLEVVTNGIASAPVVVNVSQFNFPPTAISMLEGRSSSGTLADILTSNNVYFSIASNSVFNVGQVASALIDVNLPSSNFSSLKFRLEAKAATRVSALLFLYNWTQNTYVNVGAASLSTSDRTPVFTVQGPFTNYVNGSGQLRAVVRAVMPYGVGRTTAPFNFKIDQFKLTP